MGGTLLLFPGAGGSRESPALVAVESAAPRGWRTVRADFPYRRAGRRAPDRPPVLLAAVREAITATRSRRVVVGGRSMGGRMCSMVAAGADGEAPPRAVRGVVAISYPLHPPGHPEQRRVEHFPTLGVPCLFVQGTRDPFGTPEEVALWTSTIPGPVTHRWLEGGHELNGRDADVAAAVRAWLDELP